MGPYYQHTLHVGIYLPESKPPEGIDAKKLKDRAVQYARSAKNDLARQGQWPRAEYAT